MDKPHDADGNYENIFVARQPVYTAEQEVWGYELLFRHSEAQNTATVLDPDAATAHVIADGYAIAQDHIPPDKFVLINFPKNLLLNGTALALPSAQCVPEILETVEPTPEILSACKHLKEEGYQLALDDYIGMPGYEAFLELADIIKVDIMGMRLVDITLLANKLRRYPGKLLAEKVETAEVFTACKNLGFSLFQGYFFSKPKIMRGRKVSSSELVKLDIMTLVRSDFETDDLARVMSRDVSLSYRLLKYINSPAFGLKESISTLSQAISMLGQRPIRSWLLVALLADMAPTPAAQETTFHSVQRARFLELIAEQCNAGSTPDKLFMLGLFSHLDVLMGYPMDELVPLLPFDKEMQGALTDEEHALNNWLKTTQAIEEGNITATEKFFGKYAIPLPQAARLFNQAAHWTTAILGSLKL